MSERVFVVKENGSGEAALAEVLRRGHAVKSITPLGSSALVITHDWFSSPNVTVKRRREEHSNDQQP